MIHLRGLALFLHWFVIGSFAFTSIALAKSPVLLGQERLDEPAFRSLVQGKRIGLLAHHASRDHAGQHVVDRLAALPDVSLKMIFSPEHGYRSVDDTLLPDSVDAVTRIPVYSLYGPRKAPTAAMLQELDVVVIDLQDVGLRYYTYPATVVNVMKAAKSAGKPVLLLDRPNPLGGEIVEGAVLDSALVDGGLTTLAAVPTRHGMTLGELARFFNETLAIHADLTVIPMLGWQRDQTWEDTGLPWSPPSPALVRNDQVALYAMLGTLEAGPFAVGRGIQNDLAFRVYGAPWITSADQATLVARLQALALPALEFEAYTWTPDRAAYVGQLCRGFRVHWMAPPGTPAPPGFEALVSVLQTMKSQFGSRLNLSKMLPMLGARWLLEGIEQNTPKDGLSARAKRESTLFGTARDQALLY